MLPRSTPIKPEASAQSQPVTSIVGTVEDSEEVLDLSRIARSLLRKWWIVAGVTLISTVAAGLRVLSETPDYAGSFEVLVRFASAESEVIANIPETLSGGDSTALRPSQFAVDEDLLKILQSPSVLEPLITQARTQFPELCEVPAGYATTTGALESYCYEAVASRLSVSALEDALDERSTIVRATFRHEDPQVVQFVLAQLSQAYLDYSLETRQLDIQRGIEFVEQKLPDLRSKVSTLQTELQNLRLQNNIIDPTSRAQQLSEQVGSFTREQRELSVQLRQAEAIAADLLTQQRSPQQQATSTALNENPRYQTLLASLLELDSQIAEAATVYLDTAPEMEVLREQRQNLVGLLEQEADQSQREILSQIRQLEARDQALNQTLDGLNAEVDQLTGIARSYDDIQRDLTIATENLNQFIAKREALQIDAAQREIPWELVTPPTLPTPVTISIFRYLLLGGTLGLLLGVGIALLLDESSGVIYAEEDIKRATRLPVLGTIPAANFDALTLLDSTVPQYDYATVGAGAYANVSSLDPNEPLSNNGHRRNTHGYVPFDPFSESFRTLYTNLRLLNTPQSIQSITVSSTMPGEGKSTVAMHLANAAAATGKQVLLIDTDLRSPSLHHYLALSNQKGLTNLLSGEVHAKAIQRLSESSQLYVMTVGSAEIEPNRLLSSISMSQFVQKVSSRFDLVIYDTPPLIGQSDAFLVAKQTDGLLLVTQPGKLKQSLLERAMEQLKIADIPVFGMVSRES